MTSCASWVMNWRRARGVPWCWRPPGLGALRASRERTLDEARDQRVQLAPRRDGRERVIGARDDGEAEVLAPSHLARFVAEVLLDHVEPPVARAEDEQRLEA